MNRFVNRFLNRMDKNIEPDEVGSIANLVEKKAQKGLIKKRKMHLKMLSMFFSEYIAYFISFDQEHNFHLRLRDHNVVFDLDESVHYRKVKNITLMSVVIQDGKTNRNIQKLDFFKPQRSYDDFINLKKLLYIVNRLAEAEMASSWPIDDKVNFVM